MDLVTPLMQTLQANANLGHTEAVTQDTRALAQMRQLGVVLQMQQAARNQKMAEMLQGSFSNPTGPGTPGVTAAGANTNPPPAQTNMFGIDYSPTEPLAMSLKNAQEGVDLAKKRVDMAAQVGDVGMWQKAIQDHDNQQKEYRLAQKDVMGESDRRMKEAAQAFGGVGTPEELKSALQYVNDNVSKKQAIAIARQLQKTLPDPATATPEQIQAAVAPITNRYATMGDQLRFQGSLQASSDRADALVQRKVEADQRAARAAAGVSDLSEGAINDAADVYNATGKLPAIYRDIAAKGVIMNRANERKEVGVSMPAAQAEFKATSIALTAVTKDLAAIRPYNDMLAKNADILKGLANGVIKTDTALANKPINWIQKNITGDADVAEYLSQMTIVQTEAARVINTPRLVGQLTDSARHEMQNVIDGNMTLGQTERVIDRLKADGSNRVQAIETEYDFLRKQLRGDKSGTSTAPSVAAPAGNAPAAPKYQDGQTATGPGGKKMIFRGGQWQAM